MVQLPQDAAEAAEALQVGIFGPLGAPPPAKLEENDEDVDAEGDEVEVSRKRPSHQEQLPNGSPTAKRPRLSNGYENNGADAPPAGAVTVTTPMDVDHSHDNHAYPSPLEGEQAPPPIVRTDGPEQGTQVDKVQELAPETTFIRLVTDESETATATLSSPPSSTICDSAPILLQCEWNPRDPSVLAAAGTDALARVWTIGRGAAHESNSDHVSPRALSLLDPDAPRDTTVTALSWTSDGAAIAVATDSRAQAAINVWSASGALLQTLEVSEAPVIKLSWNPSNTRLLAISPERGGALIAIYDSPTGRTLSYFLSGHDIAATPLDATWTNDGEFILCGGELLLYLHCSDETIDLAKKFETKDDDSFTQVLFDARSGLLATSSDKGSLDVSLFPSSIRVFFCLF